MIEIRDLKMSKNGLISFYQIFNLRFNPSISSVLSKTYELFVYTYIALRRLNYTHPTEGVLLQKIIVIILTSLILEFFQQI